MGYSSHKFMCVLQTMMFDMESMYELIYDYGTENQRKASDSELEAFQDELMATLLEEQGLWHYKHKVGPHV